VSELIQFLMCKSSPRGRPQLVRVELQFIPLPHAPGFEGRFRQDDSEGISDASQRNLHVLIITRYNHGATKEIPHTKSAAKFRVNVNGLVSLSWSKSLTQRTYSPRPVQSITGATELRRSAILHTTGSGRSCRTQLAAELRLGCWRHRGAALLSSKRPLPGM